MARRIKPDSAVARLILSDVEYARKLWGDAAKAVGMSGESKSGTKHSYGDKAGFIRDKYYNRNIDKIDSLSDRTYIIVGEIKEDSPLYLVGLPAGKVYFDISKIQKEMKKHGDVLSKTVMKKIPELLAHPIVITEYLPGSGTNTVNVFGNITTSSGTPIMVGVVMKMLPGGVMISKIRTVHARSDFDSLITKDSILYLSENKKETKKWFEARGQHVPTGETQFGLIRRISYSFENVNINDINDSEKL